MYLIHLHSLTLSPATLFLLVLTVFDQILTHIALGDEQISISTSSEHNGSNTPFQILDNGTTEGGQDLGLGLVPDLESSRSVGLRVHSGRVAKKSRSMRVQRDDETIKSSNRKERSRLHRSVEENEFQMEDTSPNVEEEMDIFGPDKKSVSSHDSSPADENVEEVSEKYSDDIDTILMYLNEEDGDIVEKIGKELHDEVMFRIGGESALSSLFE